MSEIAGLLHLADSGATRPVTLEWDERVRALHVQGEDADIRVAGTALHVSTGGWQGTAIHLVWESDGRPWAVTVTDSQAIQALSGMLSAVLAAHLERAIAGRLKATRRGRWTLGMLVLAALLGVGAVVSSWLLR